MLGKTNRPPVLSGDRNKFSETVTSPKSPLDFKIRSPRGMKNCDVGGGGIGLGIVAALEKSGTATATGVLIPVKLIVGNLNLNKSNPIPIVSTQPKKPITKCTSVLLEESDMDYSESYTYVTCHNGPNKSFTRVYCDGGEVLDDKRLKNLSVFYESPVPAPKLIAEAIPVYPTSDFLSSCYLCRKKLHGKDIYMYRGEKAFCSTECRHRQIVKDERKEKCRTEVSRYGDISISPYSGGQLFSTGIFAT